jgi:hypothetical protein
MTTPLSTKWQLGVDVRYTNIGAIAPVADLLPQLQQRLSWRQVLVQVAWLAAGLALVTAATGVLHVH